MAKFMNVSRMTPLACCLLSLLLGCAIPLESPGEPQTTTKPPPDAASGCLLLRGDVPTTSLKQLGGSGRLFQTSSGMGLWVLDGAKTAADSDVIAPSALVDIESVIPQDCFASAMFVGEDMAISSIDPSALGPGTFALPLDGVRIDNTLVLYVSVFEFAADEPFGLRALGIGIAPRDDTTATFVVQDPLLWTADRPNYGSSVMEEEGQLYVYGCKSRPESLTNDCFLARVQPESIGVQGEYTYFAGGGNWVESVDEAEPLVVAGPNASVRYYADKKRYLMSYFSALGDTLELRSGLGPAGPWSEAVSVARCEIPSDDSAAFCAGGIQHPLLSQGGSSGIVLSYAIQSLSSDAADRVANNPTAYWPRLISLPWPDDLP